MYCVDNAIHFKLQELTLVSSICSLFDKDCAKKIQDIYYYHHCMLKESDNQPLQITLKEINNFYLKKCIIKKVLQPEFIFSDDEEIF